MAHITEHPSRAKRRKLDEGYSTSEVTITSPSQLRDLLAFQENAIAAKQGKLLSKFLHVPKLTRHSRNHQVQGLFGVDQPR